MRNALFALFAAILCVGLFDASAARGAVETSDLDAVRPIPVLDHGRVKPFDTMARETVFAVCGHESFGIVSDGDDQEVTVHMDPVRLVLDWAVNPQWQDRPLLIVPLIELRQRLNMKGNREWISPRALAENADFRSWTDDIEAREEAANTNKEKMVYSTPTEERLDNAALELREHLRFFVEACNQSLYPVLPRQQGQDWASLYDIENSSDANVEVLQKDWGNLMDAYATGDGARLTASAKAFREELRDQAGTQYANFGRIDREVFYNWLAPFQQAWIIYLGAVAVLIAALMIRKPVVYVIGMSILAAAILFHIGAFALRCSITGWAPVTNMYETLIWVSLMTAVFAYVLELIYRGRVIAIGGAVIAILAAIIADNIPPSLGASIEPPQAVLQSQYWLIIHVLCIVSSYAAFALSWILGNIVLAQFIWGKKNAPSIRTNLHFTYRAVQIGVLLVAAGTILGGLWADVSWGKFWSWDPKEVWALICLLVYVALLHGRFAGWIKQFGMAAGAVVAFSAVVMSWYGVNFVLGAGLHSYGRGTGGQTQVYTGIAAQLVFVGVAWAVYRKRYGSRLPAEPEELAGGFDVAMGSPSPR